MILKDRKKLAKIMAVEGVTQRQLAEAAGWRSHTYLGRLLRGEAKTLDAAPSHLIAQALGVEWGDLFMSRSSTISGPIGKSGRTEDAA